MIGKEHLLEGGALLAPNHTSYMDPPLIGAIIQEEIWFIARKSLFKGFFANLFFTNFNTYPVTGTNEDRQTLRKVNKRVKEGKKVVVFPEGMRGLTKEIQPIKQGIAQISQFNKCPIIPIYIDGAFEAWPRGRRFPRLFRTITCIIGEPIPYDSYPGIDKKQAYANVQDKVKNSLLLLQNSDF